MGQNKLSSGVATAMIVAAGCLWGTTGLFIDRFNALGLGSLDISFLRSFFAALFFAAYLLVRRREAFFIRLRDLWCFLGTGVASLAFFNICYFAAIEATSMAIAAVLLYTAPVFVLFLSIPVFRERLTAKKGLAAVLVIVGCALVSGAVGSGAAITLPSLLLGLGAGFGYGLYSIFGRLALERGYGSDTVNFYTFLFCSLALAPFADFGAVTSSVQKDPAALLLMILFSLLASVAPYILYTKGLSVVEGSVASILASVEPVVASLLGIAVLREPLPDLWQLLGMLAVLFAMILPNLHFRSIVCRSREKTK